MIKSIAAKAGLSKYYIKCEENFSIAVNKQYDIRTYALLFFSYSMIGWIWEVTLFIVLQQKLVNTGFLHGPWLPIYGLGGLAALELFKNIRVDPRKIFVSIMFVAGSLEYITSAVTERVFGVTWWNYDAYFFNINGRICLEALIVFGILGSLSIYLISPKLDNLISRIEIKYQNCLIGFLGIFFILDLLLSLFNPNYNNVYM